MSEHAEHAENTALIAFLHARLDEEEELARDAGETAWSAGTGDAGEVRDGEGADIAFTVPIKGCDRHIARQDPEHTLRRIRACRVTLAAYEQVAALDTDQPGGDFGSGRAVGLGFAVRQVATAYGHHPGYRAQWLPRYTG